MMKNAMTSVLFILIGWARSYDGTETVQGGHAYLEDHPDDCGESKAFLRNTNGYFSCFAGRGHIAENSLDVVFVAREPNSKIVRVVGIYEEVVVDNLFDGDDKYANVKSKNATLFDPAERLAINSWSGQGMRRWAKRIDSEGNIKGPLYKIYKRVKDPGYVYENEEKRIINSPDLTVTEKQQLIKSRIGQGKFREQLISYWGGCSVTGFDFIEILRASHIKSWKTSSNSERLDVYNGLLLTPNLDVLFDKGLISFAKSGEILISSRLTGDSIAAIGCSKDMRIEIDRKHEIYLAHHRENVFR